MSMGRSSETARDDDRRNYTVGIIQFPRDYTQYVQTAALSETAGIEIKDTEAAYHRLAID